MLQLKCSIFSLFVLIIVPNCLKSFSYHQPSSNDLLVTLKELHLTLSKLVNSLTKENSHNETRSKSDYSHFDGKASHVDRNFITNQNKIETISSTPRSVSGFRPFQCATGHTGSYAKTPYSTGNGLEYPTNMLKAKWSFDYGWDPAYIVPVSNISMNPSSKMLMYGQQVFDVLKASMGFDNRIRLFRPRFHLNLLKKSAERLALPDFDDEELLLCIKRFILSEAALIPAAYSNSSAEIRVILAGISPSVELEPSQEALLYVYMIRHTPQSLKQYSLPKNVFIDPKFTRSWPGSLGQHQTMANYAPTLYVNHIARSLGFNDVLWVYGKDEIITSLTDSNVFIFIINEIGRRELITPPADDLIIPGVVRQTVLEMAKHWNEFTVSEKSISIHEVITLHQQRRLLEMFATNTMGNAVPIVSLYYEPKRNVIRIAPLRLRDSLQARLERAFQSIESGLIDHSWGYVL